MLGEPVKMGKQDMLMRQPIQMPTDNYTDMQDKMAGKCIICNNKLRHIGSQNNTKKIHRVRNKSILIGEKKVSQGLMKTSLERLNRLRQHHPFRKRVPQRYNSYREEALAEFQPTPLMRELELVASGVQQGR